MELKLILEKSVKDTEYILQLLKTVELKKIDSIEIKAFYLFNEQERSELYNQLATLKEKKYIYLFKVQDRENHLLKIKTAFENFNKGNKPRVLGKTRNTSRYNSKHNSNTLYVGTSKNIPQRLKQHLGDGNKRTYSLDLIHWFPKNIDLILVIYSINHQEVIESVEQAIWDETKPLFGKRSGH